MPATFHRENPVPASTVLSLKTDIVIPVHNRREVTIRCLAALHELGVPAWAGIIVVDDGSTDGTSLAIREQYPGVVLVEGDGHLWWTGAIVRGMKEALARGAELIFWLNDDCIPAAGTLEQLARHATERQGVAVGQAFTPSGFRYGAYQYTRSGLRPIQALPGEVRACDAFAGNCVCFPRALIEQAGLPDARHLPHNYGDSDYGLRLSRSGLPVEVLGGADCTNDDNRHLVSKSWLLSPTPMHRILASFFTLRSTMYPPASFRFRWRHWGAFGLLLFAAPYLRFCGYWVVRLLVPRRLLLALVSSRSSSWKRESFEGG